MCNKILFRVNAGKKYGLGHLSRNLVIAKELLKRQWKYVFLIKTDAPEFIAQFLKQRKEENYELIGDVISQDEDVKCIIQLFKTDCSFLILDHYDHDHAYQLNLREAGIIWAQYDYAMKNNIIAEMLINPNIGILKEDYAGLVNKNTSLCVGEQYALIDERIKSLKENRNPDPNTVLVAFGGGNYPKGIIDIINEIIQNREYTFLIVTQDDELKEKVCKEENVILGIDYETLLMFYKQVSHAFVAGGVTTYELAYLGIPMIIIPFAKNQLRNAREWDRNKYAMSYSGSFSFLSEYKDAGLSGIFSDLKKRTDANTGKLNGDGAENIVKKISELLG